jgi:hypothetical protein
MPEKTVRNEVHREHAHPVPHRRMRMPGEETRCVGIRASFRDKDSTFQQLRVRDRRQLVVADRPRRHALHGEEGMARRE